MIKKTAKKIISNCFFNNQIKIVIASSGRSGSTMLFDSTAKSLVKHRHPLLHKSLISNRITNSIKVFVKKLQQVHLKHELIFKTHDLFDKSYSNFAKYIFVFGDPLQSAQSVEIMAKKYGAKWFSQHLENLSSSGNLNELYSKDILNYERQVESWMTAETNSVFCVHYEDIWNKVDLLSKFVGFEIELPEKLPRKNKDPLVKFDEQLFNKLKHIEFIARNKTNGIK